MFQRVRSSHRDSRFCPRFVELLERRELLATLPEVSAIQGLQAGQAYNQFIADLRHLQRKSQATPAQYQALRNDALAIGDAAASSNVPAGVASQKAASVTLQLDRAPLDGWFGANGWAGIASILAANVNGLDVPQSLLNQTLADMQSVAASAGVTAAEYQKFSSDFNSLLQGQNSITSDSPTNSQPGVIYTQHLSGFFHGTGDQRAVDSAKLSGDLAAIEAQAGAAPAQVAAVQHDVSLLEQLGSRLTSQKNEQLDLSFVAAFDQGTPSTQTLAQLETNIGAIVGTRGNMASLRQLISDAPTFYVALGSSPSNVGAVASDLETVVGDGGAVRGNLFKVQIHR